MGAVTRIKPGGAPDQTLDLLQIDGGWLTCDYMAERLGLAHGTVRRALYTLRKYGCVTSRVVDLAFSGNRTRGGGHNRWGGATFDTRLEWSATLDPIHWA